MSRLLFIFFVELISKYNERISSLLFADDVFLLASSSQELSIYWDVLLQCEATVMKISTYKSMAKVLVEEYLTSLVQRERFSPLQLGKKHHTAIGVHWVSLV